MKATWLALAFAALAFAESALGVLAPRSIATDADWEAAAAQVRQGFKTGDLIVFLPGWVDQVGRKHLGELMPIEMVARSDDDRYGRVWELSVHDATATSAAIAVEEDRTFGRVRLRRYTKSQVRILDDLTSRFSDAQVATHLRDQEEEHLCQPDGSARRCGSTRVEPRVLEIDYHPRRGILVPVSSGETTTISYDKVPGGRLVAYAGLHDYYARKSADGVVIVRVRVDATQTLTFPIHNEDGWRRFELELAPGPHALRFEIDSDRPASRLLGFHAEVRAP